jgi:hypothetical protein
VTLELSVAAPAFAGQALRQRRRMDDGDAAAAIRLISFH